MSDKKYSFKNWNSWTNIFVEFFDIWLAILCTVKSPLYVFKVSKLSRLKSLMYANTELGLKLLEMRTGGRRFNTTANDLRTGGGGVKNTSQSFRTYIIWSAPYDFIWKWYEKQTKKETAKTLDTLQPGIQVSDKTVRIDPDWPSSSLHVMRQSRRASWWWYSFFLCIRVASDSTRSIHSCGRRTWPRRSRNKWRTGGRKPPHNVYT